ncbi:MAG: patatin-like phospholipase family protein [Prevotellaceae bacterium]|nr:patatin-like phospholipase family protein [Prevotellaceae bacterium]
MRFLCALMLVSAFCFPLSAQTDTVPQRKKVAVVLSGGGAKGVAHVTALKVIEEAGIPVDIVVGTSMGALVGGLYSIGYTTEQLDSLARNMDWMAEISDEVSRDKQSYDKKVRSEKYVLSVPFKRPDKMLGGGLFQGQRVTNLISELTFGYHDSLDFNKFPRKFACVAINVVDGSEVVFHSGVLYKTMRASMAVPGLFSPVRMNGMVLVDGGMRNNFPVDVARDMGADVVIGVDLGDDLMTEEELSSFVSVLNQLISIACKTKHEENVKNTDVYIKVDVNGYTSASFSKKEVDSLCNRGEAAAMAKWDELVALKEKIGIDSSFQLEKGKPFRLLGEHDTLFVRKIVISGIDKHDEDRLLRKIKLKENDSVRVTLQGMKDAVAYLNGTMDYSSVDYHFSHTSDGYVLNFMLEEKRNNSFNLGLRYDMEENVAVLLNLTYQLPFLVPTQVSLTGRLGERSYIRGDYTLKPRDVMGVNFSYMFQYNDINIYGKGDRLYNETYHYHMGEVSMFYVFLQRMKLKLGLRYEYYDFNNFLVDPDSYSWSSVNSGGYVSYFVGSNFDSFNRRVYPSRGSKLFLLFSLHTDNMLTYKRETPIMDALVSWRKVLPLSSRFAVIPAVSSRVLFNKEEIPYPYLNTIGGYSFARYSQYQIPFVGLGYMEIMDDAIAVFRLDLRHRIMKNHYLMLSGNTAFVGSEWSNMMKDDPFFGTSLKYGYDSLFGPLELALYHSNWSKDIGFYVNLGFKF